MVLPVVVKELYAKGPNRVNSSQSLSGYRAVVYRRWAHELVLKPYRARLPLAWCPRTYLPWYQAHSRLC